MPLKRKNAHRCFEMSQDINWHGNMDNLWGAFKQKFPQYEKIENKELKYKMDDFFSYCAKVLVETENGILLDRIGYLAMTVFDSPKKVVKWHKQILPNYKVDNGEVYRVYFFTIRGQNSVFKGFMFSINDNLKSKIKQQIEGGMKYYNHIRLLDKNSKAIKS